MAQSPGRPHSATPRRLPRPRPPPVLPRSVTLAIFPGVLAEDVASAQLGSWYPVILISLFNLADAAGKAVPGLGEAAVVHDGGALVSAALGRALFVPLFHLAGVSCGWAAGVGGGGLPGVGGLRRGPWGVWATPETWYLPDS